VSPNGKFLYSGNGTSNTITAFSIGPNGALAYRVCVHLWDSVNRIVNADAVRRGSIRSNAEGRDGVGGAIPGVQELAIGAHRQ